jgi:hypothetical protein
MLERVGFLILLCLLGACEPDPIERRQVVGLAPPGPDNLLLSVERHISLTPRPRETYAFPIPLGQVGPVDSLYSGRRQYPFYCQTLDAGLGQPLVDNQEGHGVVVYGEAEPDKRLGYSKDCLTPSRLDFFYARRQDEQILPYDRRHPPALADIATTSVRGQTVPQIFRLERGSINRYLYLMAMLVPKDSLDDRLNQDFWNHKLIYQLKGGASIGFRQGAVKGEAFIDRRRQELAQGFAVIGASGNDTSTGYNMLLAEDTARRVKAQFVSLYGAPLYTLGLGGSGGALAQYLIAQNSDGILDGLMPLYSYPDMVSQSISILDCDLLQHYFNVTDRSNGRWLDWEQRQKIEGMNGINGFEHPYAFLIPLNQLLEGVRPSLPKGSSECVSSWFTSSTFFYNPHQGFIKPYFSPEVVKRVNWTYWQDLAQIYGVDEQGFARTTWGNEGVQYGLRPLLDGELSIGEFLHLNSHIGAWQPQDKMQPEKALAPFGDKYPLWVSLWSRHNITRVQSRGNGLAVAPRKSTDKLAVAQGYRYGQVFVGKLDLPILEIRHYLEDELNMHHAMSSFESRLRLQQYAGHSDNQIIWMSDKNYTPIPEGIKLMDKWLLARRASKTLDTLGSKPAELQDACMDAEGRILARGEGVWDGVWNARPLGPCSRHFPIYGNSRIQAGGPWAGSIFECALTPVAEALAKGVYAGVDMEPYRPQLEAIFPSGVCDYSRGDAARSALGLEP